MFRIPSRLLRMTTLTYKHFSPKSVNLAPMTLFTSRYFSSSCNSNSACKAKCTDGCQSCYSILQLFDKLSIEHSQCWNCHHFTNCNERFCPECHKIQPVYSLEEGGCNYFQLFGMYGKNIHIVTSRPETYDLDLKKLELNFRNLQKVLHPDLYSTKSEVCSCCICFSVGGESCFCQCF